MLRSVVLGQPDGFTNLRHRQRTIQQDLDNSPAIGLGHDFENVDMTGIAIGHVYIRLRKAPLQPARKVSRAAREE